MRRQFVVGFLVLALSAAAVASAGAVGRADGRSCSTQRFPAVIQALGTDGVALKVQGRDRAVTFRLLFGLLVRHHHEQQLQPQVCRDIAAEGGGAVDGEVRLEL